jgi:hypothetical protein
MKFGNPVVESFQCYCNISFGCLQYPEIFIPLRQNLFSETARGHMEQIRGRGWVFHSNYRFLHQKLLDREYIVSWSTVMMQNPITGPKFRPSSMHSFM